MSLARAALVVGACALVGAGALALASRTPASIRNARPGPDATDPSGGATFTDAEIDRHAHYRAPSYLSYALQTALGIIVLVVLARGPLGRFLDRIAEWPGGWPTRALAGSVVVLLVTTLATLPISYVRGFAMEHAWGLSTQDTAGWFSDVGR